MPDYCALLKTCGGCPWGDQEIGGQRTRKLESVRSLFSGVRFMDTANLGLRDRVDLQWNAEGKLGLYSHETREVVDIPECPLLSERLAAFLHVYRERRPPIAGRGSVRLRISPDGQRGVWLDFANVDVKALFDERSYLRWLSDLAFVEIGQRRKHLVWREDGSPRLVDPELRPWFETYGPKGQAIPLWGPVGGFSQAGFAVNRVLVDAVASLADLAGAKQWTDMFSGNGNFALALAARGYRVRAFENDPLAIEGLRRSGGGVDIVNQELYRLETPVWSADANEGLVVDPPRSGLRGVLDLLAATPVHSLIYVSCYTETFLEDALRLKEMGYRPLDLVGVDQFPHTPHTEWVGLFQRY